MDIALKFSSLLLKEPKIPKTGQSNVRFKISKHNGHKTGHQAQAIPI